ncbi:hypothetical protein PISMIDRAFT_16132 [Pisolithus microcarpus 441]|uniref:Integrase catalytic domain-containing protein n=1 Tax=Pisolithus microcarpus 441 TaxID=765257 RepID=A0A0C9Z7U5_9AGAM|nr:hypothetical protein PISMIDRAFT_16132 [Pisolithus microcarpus 441]
MASSTILDSGTTMHLIRDPSLFWTFTHDSTVSMKTANQGSLNTEGYGNCVAVLKLGDKRIRLKLEHCLYAPNAVVNLLSVGRMVEHRWELRFKGEPSWCELIHSDESLGCINMRGQLCFLDVEFVRLLNSSSSQTSVSGLTAFTPSTLTWDLWHARLGHLGADIARFLPVIVTGAQVTSSAAQMRCESCIIAKHPRQPFPSSTSAPTRAFLELVYTDLCGPFPTPMLHRKQYFIIFIDDYMNVVSIHLLATKDQAYDAWQMVKTRWENHFNIRVKAIQTDNGSEYMGSVFTTSLLEAGVEHRRSVAYAHQQNGKVERGIRTVEGRALAALNQAGLSAAYFGEAILMIGYLWNLTGTRVLPGSFHFSLTSTRQLQSPWVELTPPFQRETHRHLPLHSFIILYTSSKTPFEMLYGYKPDISHLRVFGSRCFSWIPPERRMKNGPHSSKALFMGYPDGIKGWRLRDCATGAFFNSRDMVFDEGSVMQPRNISIACRLPGSVVDSSKSPSAPTSSTSSPLVPSTWETALSEPRRSNCPRVLTEKGQLMADELQRRKDRLTIVPGTSEGVDDGGLSEGVTDADEGETEENEVFVEHQVNLIITEQSHLSIRSDTHRDPGQPGYDMSIPPATYKEAMKQSDHEGWKEAMEKELRTMKEMGVWKLVEPPCGRKLVGNRWVFEFKPIDLKGGSRFKARLVVQGFSQVPSVDFHQTYAPVARQASVKLLITMAAQNDWELDCFDAKHAFLHGKLMEEIYMKQPRGFERYNDAGTLLVCLLLCSLYGLKQVAYDWYITLSELLRELGFSRSDVDLAVFILDRVEEDGRRVICIIIWHIDDGLGSCNSRHFLNWVKGKISEHFGISDLGPVTLYLRIEIERRRETREIWIHQESYISHVCKEYGLGEANPLSLPMDPNHPFGLDMDVSPDVPDLEHAYRKIVGELTYLATCSRPDIAQAVQHLAQQCAHAEPRHFAAAKRVLRYLKGTRSLRLQYGNLNVNHLPYAFSDSDWATCLADRVSIMGYIWFYYGGPIAHASKKQHTLVLSSMEAEYMALAACAQEGLWLHSIHEWCLEDERRQAEEATTSRIQDTLVEAGLEIGYLGENADFEMDSFHDEDHADITDRDSSSEDDSEDDNELVDANPIFSKYFLPASHS